MIRLGIYQELANGPWRWIILSEDGVILGRSDKEYDKAGNARRALFSEIVQPIAAMDVDVATIRSYQLPLFPNRKIDTEVKCEKSEPVHSLFVSTPGNSCPTTSSA